jgi:hypothetical protein
MIRTSKNICLLIFSVVLLVSGRVSAGIDTPGMVSFDFIPFDDQKLQSFEEIPNDTPFSSFGVNAFFSSDASRFGEEGVLIWAGFDLSSDAGQRFGMLWIDIDLSQAPIDGEHSVPHPGVVAQMVEKQGDTLLFVGNLSAGDVWILDAFFHQSDGGGVEGDFDFLFNDPSSPAAGSRVFIRGHFITDPSPSSLRRAFGVPGSGPDGEVYSDTGCSGNMVFVEGCDCGGSDESSGCEGDSSSSSGCEGDSSSSGGCGGDASASSNCGDCAGDAQAAVKTHSHRGQPLTKLLMFFPEVAVGLFIVFLKRRNRP